MVNTYESKYAHETNQYDSARNDFGIDRQLSYRAAPKSSKTTSIDAVREHILISYASSLIIPTTHSPG